MSWRSADWQVVPCKKQSVENNHDDPGDPDWRSTMSSLKVEGRDAEYSRCWRQISSSLYSHAAVAAAAAVVVVVAAGAAGAGAGAVM